MFVISFILSPSDSEDFPDGGTWTKCSACQKTQVVDSEARGVFYDENPNMMGRPMVCPKCKKGSLIGAIIQFGGQTPLNIAKEIEKNTKILGTSPNMVDLSEDREDFKKYYLN